MSVNNIFMKMYSYYSNSEWKEKFQYQEISTKYIYIGILELKKHFQVGNAYTRLNKDKRSIAYTILGNTYSKM